MFEKIPRMEEPSFFVQSYPILEDMAEIYLREIKSRDNTPPEILGQTAVLLAKTLEDSKRMLQRVEHLWRRETERQDSLALKKGSVRDSVYQILRAMQIEFPMERITLLKILPHDLLPPLIPSGYLEAILFQLLYNAREMVGEVPGIVTVEAAEKNVLSVENKNPHRFILRVSDTGPAIPKEYLEHLYDPLFNPQNPCRLHGIGLCLVKGMVAQCQGLMRIETSLMGTSYFIEFSR